MATYIKTLKEDNGDITYPQTTADAVLNTNGSSTQGGTVQAFLNKAVTAEEIAVTTEQTPMVTASMINWSTMQPTVTTVGATASGWFAPTWYKRVYADGRIIYSCNCQSISITFNASGWGWGGALIFPDSVTFNPAKMSVSVCMTPGDTAITLSPSVVSGQNGVIVAWTNQYSGAVTTVVHADARLEVFPN